VDEGTALAIRGKFARRRELQAFNNRSLSRAVVTHYQGEWGVELYRLAGEGPKRSYAADRKLVDFRHDGQTVVGCLEVVTEDQPTQLTFLAFFIVIRPRRVTATDKAKAAVSQMAQPLLQTVDRLTFPQVSLQDATRRRAEST
jgi:hypothetical protein